jgi:hypothetical protein
MISNKNVGNYSLYLLDHADPVLVNKTSKLPLFGLPPASPMALLLLLL